MAATDSSGEASAALQQQLALLTAQLQAETLSEAELQAALACPAGYTGGQILLQTTAGNLSLTADQRQSLKVGLQRIADLDEQIQAVQAYVEETASQLSTMRSSASNRSTKEQTVVSNCLSVGMPTSDKHRVRKQTSHAAKALQAQRSQRESLVDSGAEAVRPAIQETEGLAVTSPYDPAALQAEAAPHAATFEDVQLQLAALELHRCESEAKLVQEVQHMELSGFAQPDAVDPGTSPNIALNRQKQAKDPAQSRQARRRAAQERAVDRQLLSIMAT